MMSFTKSLYSVAALMVYISVLEQQAKYGDALEILSGKLGLLIMIEVDRLRMQVLSTQTLCCTFALLWDDYIKYKNKMEKPTIGIL